MKQSGEPGASADGRAMKHKTQRYVVLLGRDGEPPHLYDTETQVKVMSYPTVVEAERQAMLLNRFIRPGLAPE